MARKPAKTKLPNDERRAQSKAHILRAAGEIFAERGFEGTRIEEIARHARCNRGLVYFYFTSKKELFRAVLAQTVMLRRRQMDKVPTSLAEIMLFWSEEHRRDPLPIRLLLQEGIAFAGERAARPAERRAYYDEQVAGVAQLQQLGLLRNDISAREAFAIGLAVTSFPALLPQVTAAVAGANAPPTWDDILRALARLFAPPGK